MQYTKWSRLLLQCTSLSFEDPLRSIYKLGRGNKLSSDMVCWVLSIPYIIEGGFMVGARYLVVLGCSINYLQCHPATLSPACRLLEPLVQTFPK